MQIVRYFHEDKTHWGYLAGDQVGPISGDIYGDFSRGRKKIPLAEVKLLTPCAPSKIIGLTRNYVDRVRETGDPAPDMPTLFLKPPSAVIGSAEPILLPPQAQTVTHGAELAVVMGRRARWVTPDQATSHILGYTCANDVTAQDLVEADKLWARGKGFDTFCPLGPCIATGLDPTELLITCKVNGETRQMSSTHDMLFAVPKIVAFISSIMTLLPGDVILTGTPGGAQPLRAGDTVEVDIEGIGILKNEVKAEER